MGTHKSIKVADDLYCYVWRGRGNNCNSVLLVDVLKGTRPHILVDPGHVRNEAHEQCFDSLVDVMEQDGLKMEEVGLIISTHCHPDHFEASEIAAQKSGALVAMSCEEEEFYRQVGEGFFGFFGSRPPAGKVSLFLKEGVLSVDGTGGTGISVFITPGHSPGSVSLYREEDKILISGDVVFQGGVGRTDFPGGNPAQLRRSIERLAALDVECLIPGHSMGPEDIICGKRAVESNFQMIRRLV